MSEPVSVPETVPAPAEAAFAEGTWKGRDSYFTIRFLEDGRLNFIQYSLEPLGEETGFGGLDAHYVTYQSCDYKVESSGNSISFTDGNQETIVIERDSNGLKIRTGKSGDSTLSPAEGPTVYVPARD